MTRLESILRDRAWRGAVLSDTTLGGRPAIKIVHPPSGAEAVIYKEAAGVQVRHIEAYNAMRVARELSQKYTSEGYRRAYEKARLKYAALARTGPVWFPEGDPLREKALAVSATSAA